MKNKKVDYLVMVCKAAQNYASTQSARLSKVRDGKHMINQLRDVANDLGRQADKVLAVYDTREVRHSADRLGETITGVYDLLGDVEGTSIMFGKKRYHLLLKNRKYPPYSNRWYCSSPPNQQEMNQRRVVDLSYRSNHHSILHFE